MKPRLMFTTVALALALLGMSQPARAQEHYDFNMTSGFVAGGKSLPPGDYYVFLDDGGPVLKLEAKDPKMGTALMPVETRISARKDLGQPEIVFDRLNGKLYLSELLIPGDDGYLLLVTKAKHTHQSVAVAHVKK